MQAILVAGFGNLGAKLLSLKWVFAQPHFFFLEKYWGDEDEKGGYLEIKEAFDEEVTLRKFLDSPFEVQPSDPSARLNLSAFRDALQTVEYNHPDALFLDQNRRLGEIFEECVYYCGNFEEDSEEQSRYKKLIERLIEYDPSKVLLYLAARPEDYLWYLQRYAPFVNRVAVDKPLAMDIEQLDEFRRFSLLNPDLEIRPIDHYLFKLDFHRFNQLIEIYPDKLDPQTIQRINVIIHEKGLDEHRRYFIDTGIIRDMMPHVAAMLRYMFRHSDRFTGYVGNVLPVVREYEPPADNTRKIKPTIVQACIDVNYWTGWHYIPVTIEIAKGMSEAKKEIVIHYDSGGHDRLDLTRRPELKTDVSVDWEGALTYLMAARPLAESVKSHFTFERACEITEEVFICHKQADSKIPVDLEGCGDTFFKYDEKNSQLPPREPDEKRVVVFNFDGVVVNTEVAHKQAWNTWRELLGVERLFADVTSKSSCGPTWFKLGKPNRRMINEALHELSSSGKLAKSLDEEFSEKLYYLFCRLLQSKKVVLLRSTLLHDKYIEAIAKEEGIEPSAFKAELARLNDYHDEILEFLEELRRHNYVLILASTNDPLLAQQAIDILLERKGAADDRLFTGFCRYFVGRRSGLDAYEDIIKQYRNHGRILIIDDYRKVLEDLAKEEYDNVRFVHMHTSERDCGCEGYDNFKQVRENLETLLS